MFFGVGWGALNFLQYNSSITIDFRSYPRSCFRFDLAIHDLGYLTHSRHNTCALLTHWALNQHPRYSLYMTTPHCQRVSKATDINSLCCLYYHSRSIFFSSLLLNLSYTYRADSCEVVCVLLYLSSGSCFNSEIALAGRGYLAWDHISDMSVITTGLGKMTWLPCLLDLSSCFVVWWIF